MSPATMTYPAWIGDRETKVVHFPPRWSKPAPTEVPIGQLPPGSMVTCPWNGAEVEVLEQRQSGTAVRIHRPAEKRFTTREGKEVRIRKTYERTTWSSDARVVPKEGP